jgi:hypothetical protein
VFLTGTGKEVVTARELDASYTYGASEDHDLFCAFVSVTGKPSSSRQSHDRRAASSVVVSKEATFDARVIGCLPLAISGFLHEHK